MHVLIHIKIIEARKYYKWIFIGLIFLLCIFSVRVFLLDTKDVIVKASSLEKDSNFVQAEKFHIDNHLLIYIFNKSLAAIEVNYRKDHPKALYKDAMALFIRKVVNFDYKKPETLFKAQLSVLNEVDDDLAELQDHYAYDDDKNQKDQKDVDINSDKNIDSKHSSSTEASSSVNSNLKDNTQAVMNVQKSKGIEVLNSSAQMPDKVQLDMSKPFIYIYHTHGTESYMPETIGNFHSTNRKYTVRAVGDHLTKHLMDKGYKVIHNETLHDYPSYQRSYARSLNTLNTSLEKNPSLRIVFDIHRDAAPDTQDARKNSYVVINNEKVAKFSIVVGTKNPNAKQLKKFAEYIKAKCDARYPGLAKKTILKEFKFNQYRSDYYALIEIGNTKNNIDETLNTTKYLAEVLSEVIEDIKK